MKKKSKRHSKRSKQKTQHRLVEGIAKRNPKGFGWLESDEKKRGGIFIPPKEMMCLLDGDKILCEVEDSHKGPVAYVKQILERGHTSVVGTFKQKKNRCWVEAQHQTCAVPIFIDPKSCIKQFDLENDTLVEVEFLQFPTRSRPAEGKIQQVFGKEGDFLSEIELILKNGKVRQDFPPEASNQALVFPEDPDPKSFKKRKDLRALPLCTIDGETAKDFDDAVFAEPDGENTWVYVAIADVSTYVTPNSPIDKEALERGTSLYYPGNCVPMLPEQLSNGLCSLKPNVPRLSMVAKMLITPTGRVKKAEFYEAVIQSHARLTYRIVQDFVDQTLTDEKAIPKKVAESIKALKIASQNLRKNRKRRGAIDFDVVESLVAIGDNGEPVSINPTERLEAHRMIEDLMVAANETVATFLEKNGWPAIFRVHEKPQSEKLDTFINLSKSVGALTPKDVLNLNKEDIDPKALASVIKKFQDHKAKASLDILLLRSMMQAKYSASNLGHFGLASKSYLHFTSPIRRYPDLAAHRVLKQAVLSKGKKLSKNKKDALHEELETIAARCSERERKAVDVERQIDSLHSAWFMQDKVGEEDDGTVTGCTEFGLFIRLSKYHIEGLAHIAGLSSNNLTYNPDQMCLNDKKTGRSFRLGDKLKVKVISVNVGKRFIDLEVVQKSAHSKESESGRKEERRSKRKRKSGRSSKP